MRVAAIDCGTNSLRLLVADIRSGTSTPLVRRTTIVRLGQDVDRTGRLADDALARTFRVCEEYATEIAALQVERIRFVATSATRDAANRDVFLHGVRSRLGVSPDVVTGDEEARLSFRGATSGLATLTAVRPPVLVLDLGGGSTEFVLGGSGPPGDRSVEESAGDHGADVVVAARSVDVGAVRITERRLTSDPPTDAQIESAVVDIDAAIALAAGGVDLPTARSLVGVAGTITTVAAAAMALERYDRAAIHHAVIDVGAIHEACRRLLRMPRVERGALPFIAAGRVDVIGGGALVLDRVLAALPQIETLIVSETDILDGIAAALAE